MSQALVLVILAFGGIATVLLVLGLYPERFLAKARAAAQAEERGVARAAGGMLVGRLGNLNKGFVSEGFRSRMVKKFVAMGAPKMRPEDFIAYQELCALLFGVLALLLLNVLKKPLAISLVFFMLHGLQSSLYQPASATNQWSLILDQSIHGPAFLG